jgi:hypothetical protein
MGLSEGNKMPETHEALPILRRRKKILVVTLAVSTFICICCLWPHSVVYFMLAPIMGERFSECHFSVDAARDDRPVFTFRQSDNQAHPFVSIAIYEFDPSMPQKDGRKLWLLREESPYKDHLLRLTYGLCPPSFKQISGPDPLVSGHLYRVCTFRVNELFKKNGPNHYEHFSWERYRNGVKTGLFKIAK